ncbi:MAG: dynamin family protein, partial [Vulcanimicrobiaceae bacterium]
MEISALETINAIAKRHGDEGIVRESQWLADRVHANELTVLVAGQFKRGKSTFLNALVGQDLLPTGVLPLTSVPTMIHHGLVPQAVVSFRDGGSMTIALGDIGSYVTEAENPDNRLRVARVDVELPVELLKGLRLVDTPGIASTFVHNTDTARDALREADLAILVVAPEPPIGEAEIHFAKEVREAAERLFVVYNKADLLAEQQHELVHFTKTQLE